MPFKSKAQQGYMHAAEDRGDMPHSVVDEFDQASKGQQDLPEHMPKDHPAHPSHPQHHAYMQAHMDSESSESGEEDEQSEGDNAGHEPSSPSPQGQPPAAKLGKAHALANALAAHYQPVKSKKM